MLNKIYLILYLLLSAICIQAQTKLVPIPKPIKGDEVYKITSKEAEFKISKTKINYPPVKSVNLNYIFSSTNVFTVYDLQSNGVPNEIWQDPLHPLNVHACVMYSLVPGFGTRPCAYLYSYDAGATWTILDNVPEIGRSGFPSITGLTSGAAVIANHNTSNGTLARTKIYYDAGPGVAVFTEIDPGLLSGADGIWPRVVATGSNSLAFISSLNGQIISATNTCSNLNPPGIFSGYVNYDGDQAEGYSLSIAPNGKVGHAYIGNGDGTNDNDVFYRSSTNGGLTWTSPVLVWNFTETTDSLGCLRGVSMVFGNNNEPYVVFNLGVLTLDGNFYPERPSSIRLWSPAVNGGTPIIIADQNNVPFFPNKGIISDAFLPVCRPAIGRSSAGNNLFIAFTATTGQYSPVDSSSYYAGWFTASSNNGISWMNPERMTPLSPLRDWRYVSISPVSNTSGGITTVQMLIQDDSLAGAHVQGGEIGRAAFIGIRTNFSSTPVPPGAPVLNLPANGSTDISVTPLLDWFDDLNATSYNLQVSRNPSFINLILNQTGITSSEFQITQGILSYDSVYYWRVSGTNAVGTGPYSTVFNFRTVTFLPAAPILLSPPNGAVDVFITLTLDWSDLPFSTYTFQLATDSIFSNPLINISNLVTSQYSITNPLSLSTKYYWRVNGTNQNGTGPYSLIFNFTTVSSIVPAAPVLLLPVNGAVNINLLPTLDWNNVVNANRYNLQLATDSLFTNPILNIIDIPVSQYTLITSLVINTKYYWRVSASNSNGTGPWSLIWNFTTVTAPSAPVLLLPLNGATVNTLNPLLDWDNTAGVINYKVQIATDSLLGNIIFEQSNLTVSQVTIPSPYLTYLSRYFWRVNVTTTNGTSPWSTVWNFTTLAIPIPPAPVLFSPANNSVGNSTTPLLDWSTILTAEKYRVSIAADLFFNNIVYNIDTVYMSEFRVPSGVLIHNGLYFWRVNASNSSGVGPWSTVWVFRTGLTGIQLVSSEIPDEYKLYYNYPNPFNPVTKVKFDLAKTSFVELKVYDLLGREVKKIFMENLSAGKYEINISGEDLTSGVYYYRIVAGEFTDTKRMILLK